MHKKIIPFLTICLTAGMIAACSSSLPLIGDAESSIQDGNYEAALTAAEKAISKHPKNAAAYYYKGVALGQQGQDLEAPTDATEYYKNMNKAFSKAQELGAAAEEAPEELQNIGAVKTSVWRTEHNKGVEYATNDSLMQTIQNPLEVAIAHMNNATIVQPDSALSWNVLAQLNNMQQNYKAAAEAQQVFIEKADSLQTKDYLLLAQYYRLGDQPQEAIEILETTRQQYPDSTQVVEILADSYSQAGQSDKAIAMVEELVQNNPDNAQYRLSLGTQIYQKALSLREEYTKNVDEIYTLRQQLSTAEDPEAVQQQVAEVMQENKSTKQEIDELADRAIEHLKAGIESRPDDDVAYNTLGIIYQNKAAAMYDQRNLTRDNEKAAQFDSQASELLQQALTYYEKAAELAPDNSKYWQSLYQIYTQLGMDQKAQEASQKAGI